jgi:hypothetical protein
LDAEVENSPKGRPKADTLAGVIRAPVERRAGAVEDERVERAAVRARVARDEEMGLDMQRMEIRTMTVADMYTLKRVVSMHWECAYAAVG